MRKMSRGSKYRVRPLSRRNIQNDSKEEEIDQNSRKEAEEMS
jgi:hypothetical protein